MYTTMKHPVLKIGGYIIMGFLTLVIIISFGMPDFLSRMNANQNTAAIVNGQQVTRMELARAMKINKAENEDGDNDGAKKKQILYQLIDEKLHVQFAEKIGIRVSDENVTAQIRKYCSDENGNFSDFRYKRILEANMMSSSSFSSEIRNGIARNEIIRLYRSGLGVSKEEVLFHIAAANASFQTRFAFVPNEELKTRFAGQVAVTDKEIDDEMLKNKKELQNPATDRERFKSRIADRKLEDAKNSLVKSVDELAAKEATFEAAAALLGGKVALSDIFKPGDPVREPGKDSKPLYSLSGSDVFRSDFSVLKPGVTSKAISSHEGIYIFTPVKKEISFTAPKDEDVEKMDGQLRYQLFSSIDAALYQPFWNKSEKIPFIKDDKEEE